MHPLPGGGAGKSSRVGLKLRAWDMTDHPPNRHNRVKESCRVLRTPLKLPSEDGDAN